MTQRPERVKDVEGWSALQELDQHGKGLTQWEIDFVESLTSQLLKGYFLTNPQRRRLREISEERL